MDNLNSTLAKNLKNIRSRKNLSLDELSKLTDIDKTMLEKIESGEKNPSITTVWKITNGLKISFSSLTDEVQNDALLIKSENQTAIIADEGNFLAYPVFPYDKSKHFEVYKIDIKKGSMLSSEPHPNGTCEYITVFSGKLMVLASGKKYSLSQGDALKFEADCNHSYHNVSDELVSLSMIIYYSK